REAAAVLGAPPRRVWREVDLPIVARALAVGAGFAASVSLGEFGATSFIVRPDTLTIPTMIFRLLGRPGAVTYAGAMAAAVVLMVTTTLLILAVDRLRSSDVGTF
ncbi:MAG: iron ABC transporter permease, partial [Acidimicrobiia bacterium]